MIPLYLPAVLLWLAVGYRVYVLRAAPGFTNASYAVAVTCLAAAATTHPLESAIDAATGPYVSDLAQHLLAVGGGLAAQLFLLALRTGAPTGRPVRFRVVVAAAAAGTMCVAFAAAPIHTAVTGDLDVVHGANPWVAVYRLAFSGQLAFVLVDNVRLCRRHAAAPGDLGRTVNLTVVGWSCAIALTYVLSRVAYVLVDITLGDAPELIGTAGTYTAALGLCGLALGILAPRTVNGTRTWLEAGRNTRRLGPLWTDLTRTYPQLVLPTGPPLSPRRAQLRYGRRLVEVSEGLALTRVQPVGFSTGTALPVQAVARALRQTGLTKTDEDTTAVTSITAAALLPATFDAAQEHRQLLALADAYTHTPTQELRDRLEADR